MITLYPPGAISILYKSGKHFARYWIWCHDGVTWHWSALGNGGSEPTRREAETQAKSWIKDGVKSLKRNNDGD